MTHLFAPAKLTWFLEIVGRRDDGYHLLRSEMVSLDLGDELDVVEDDVTSVTWQSELDVELQVPAKGEDLIERALVLLGKCARVKVLKRIPTGGGLGGGSADAAAVLRWAGHDNALDAAQLGGDVPFCLHGGRALVEGIGERISPLTPLMRDVTLVTAPFSVSTPACYRAYDEIGGAGRNHLEAAARAVEPRLDVAMQWLSAELGETVELAGSGSTMFVEGRPMGDDRLVLESPVGVLRSIPAVTTEAY